MNLSLRLAAAYAILAALAAGALLTGCAVMAVNRRRRTQWDAQLARKYLRLLLWEQLAPETVPIRFPLLGRPRARMILAETIAELVRSTCGLDPEPLRRVVRECRLDRYLLRCAARCRGDRRAYCLALLGALPLGSRTVRRLGRYSRSHNAHVRFQSLMGRLAAEPAKALQLIAAHPAPLSPDECAAIVALLCRGILPIAYEPLIASPDRNLRMVGLGIVRRFGIEEAEERLLQLTGTDPEMRREALYTLCALHCRLSRESVMRALALLTDGERRALLRFMVTEGYSVRSLAMLFRAEDRPYFEHLADSYKRRIVCSVSV